MIDLQTTTRQFLTPEEVAEIFMVTRRSVYYWIRKGKLPFVQPNGWGTRIPTEAVRVLVSQRVSAVVVTGVPFQGLGTVYDEDATAEYNLSLQPHASAVNEIVKPGK